MSRLLYRRPCETPQPGSAAGASEPFSSPSAASSPSCTRALTLNRSRTLVGGETTTGRQAPPQRRSRRWLTPL